MTKNRKLLIAILIVATIALAGISIFITSIIRDQNLQSQTGAETSPILSNCNSTTNTCTIPAGVCNPAKVYIHFCNDLKKDNEKCVSTTPTEISTSPVSTGASVNLNDYLKGVTCGTVQMYLELENSDANSLGACGTTIKKFATTCGSNSPTSFPVSTPVNTNQPNTNTNTNTNNTGTQLAQPQFLISNSTAASCESSGSALMKYTISITNISTVSGTINKVEEVIDSKLISNSISPINISNSGTLASNKITWAENSTARTFNASQTKTYTYEIRIPKDQLATFQNGQTSTATVTYNTSQTQGNTHSFVLTSKHSCAIPTTNTVVTTTPTNNSNIQTLPQTGIDEDFKLLVIGITFILLAVVLLRFKIGELLVDKMQDLQNKK